MFVIAIKEKVFLSVFYLTIAVLLYFIMRITQMPGIFVQKKNKSAELMLQYQKPQNLGKSSASHQLNTLLTFKKPSKIGKKELFQMLGKKNSVISGTFTLENNRVLLITESKQAQKPLNSFRKKLVKTTIHNSLNQNQSNSSIKKEISVKTQRRHNVNFDFIKKYFSKNHLFNDEKSSTRQEKPLKGVKLIINDKHLQELNSMEGEDWRMKRLDKQKGKVEFINNFMRTRYKTVHNHKGEYQKRLANTANSAVFIGRYSERRKNTTFTPWEKKQQYDQFQI